MRLHEKHDKTTVEKCLDAINKETINCRESLTTSMFKKHANQMMRSAYNLDSILRQAKLKKTYHSLQELKNYIKELQHPIIKPNGDISAKTFNEISYILYCLADLADELNI